MPKPFVLSKRSQGLSPPPINWLIQYQLSHPDVISLAAGLVDYPSLPKNFLAEIYPKLLNSKSYQKNLQYGTTQGAPELREKIADLFNNQENPGFYASEKYIAKKEHCIVTNGSQQLLFLLADILLNPGDILLVESPSYFVFTAVLETFDVECIPIAMDEEGLIPHILEEKLEELKEKNQLEKLKCLYTVDFFQNPTGRSLSSQRRKEVYEIISHYNNYTPILIIEDAAYRDLGFDSSRQNSIKGYDTDNQLVAYTSTFSKSFCPGLKLGYGFLPEIILESAIRHKGNHDFGSSNLNQAAIYAALKEGYYQTQVQILKSSYKLKAELMHQALKEFLPVDVHFSQPEGGLYFWLKFPENIPTGQSEALFKLCLKHKVIYVPGGFCYAENNKEKSPLGSGKNEMRLSFGTASDFEIKEGIRRLAAAVEELNKTL